MYYFKKTINHWNTTTMKTLRCRRQRCIIQVSSRYTGKTFLFNVITKCFPNPERLGKTKPHWNWIFLLKYYNPIRDYYFQSYLIQSKSRRNNKKHGKYTQGAILHRNKPKCLSKCGLGELNQVPWGCKIWRNWNPHKSSEKVMRFKNLY